MQHTPYRLAWKPCLIARGPMTKVARELLATEIPILEAMYGDGAVQLQDPATHGTARYHDTTPAQEFERLARMYGTVPEQTTTWCAQVYGTVLAGGLESVMAADGVDSARRLAMSPGKYSGLSLAPAQDAKAAATAVPATTDPGDDGTQGEIDGVRPTGRDALAAELEQRQLKVRVRDTVPHLQAMVDTVRALEQLGAVPAPGGGLEELTEQLAAVRAAAGAGTDDDGQAELEQAAAG